MDLSGFFKIFEKIHWENMGSKRSFRIWTTVEVDLDLDKNAIVRLYHWIFDVCCI